MMLKDCGTLGGTRIPGEKKISGETPPQWYCGYVDGWRDNHVLSIVAIMNMRTSFLQPLKQTLNIPVCCAFVSRCLVALRTMEIPPLLYTVLGVFLAVSSFYMPSGRTWQKTRPLPNNGRLLLSCPHKSHMTWSALEPGPLRWEAAD
jgi:hypothetical protein